MSWFARRFPVGHPRNAAAPVSWQGWAVAGAFVAGMLLGAIAFAVVGLLFGIIWGAISFALIAFLSGAAFILVAMRTSDPLRMKDFQDNNAGHR